MIFSCNCMNIKFYIVEHKCPVDDTISSIVSEDENLCPLLLDIGGISIEQPSLLKIKQHTTYPEYYTVQCCNCYYMNNSNAQNQSSLISTNKVPIYIFRGIKDKTYDEMAILNKEIIPNNGVIILNKNNVLTEESMQAAKMNINYSEVYKLILNPQLPKYHLSKSNMSEEYSSIFSELQTSLTDYIDKQYKEMEQNIENYRNRLLLQFNNKKEKAGKEREALWNVICGINADNTLNSSHKKIVFDPVIEVSDSLQSYHQQRTPYPISSYTNNARRFSDNNQFFTYHSYKMSSMAAYAHNRADIRPDTKNVFDVTTIKEELNNSNDLENVTTDLLNDEKNNKPENDEKVTIDQEDNKEKNKNTEQNENNEAEGSTQALSSSQVSKELNDNMENIDISNDNLSNENNKNNDNKKDKTDDDIFLLDGFDDNENKEKYIPDEELDEEYDQVNEMVNISSRYNNPNNLSIYATSVPIKIPERQQPTKNEDSSPDKDNSNKEFTPPHIIIARTYQNDEVMMHPNHANKYFSVAY
ncbi:hypothetical protein H8356DRAFT_1724328 [Neocallimastix lanati (nom. inval.)]|uniref:Uncharacterized protein n=1 Tax=Neocallimastix californiae TaxID=1754190 RepID=A0A1Y2AF30_9FUNG|nr:hypothetical protein H8356DRAFT_1724328 [Neocallimastix sp. JGI-2020a]ORY21198.1 hypothetical protein LY90DRAFT_676385 [Neocallimastix californiae]|eukprot:ORY21198.1 hypothetical protein LY90DRAFT_676385 [Neocallimastix californiae]